MQLALKSTNEPFQPLIQMADGRRSALPDDLSQEWLLTLKTYYLFASYVLVQKAS